MKVEHWQPLVEDVAKERGEEPEDEESHKPEAAFGDLVFCLCVNHATTFFDVK